MRLALDTNILVSAHRAEAPHHPDAVRMVRELAEGTEPWGLPWPCVYEFLRVVTHPRVFHPPTSPEVAWKAVTGLLQSPSVVVLSETDAHSAVVSRLMSASRAAGNLVHDLHIAALLIEHGITTLLTLDEDFHRFPDIRAENPFRPRAK